MSETIWIYLLSGVLGGTSFTAFFRYLSTRRFQSISLEEKLRAEMLEMNRELKIELDTLKQELDHWKDKYFTLSKEHTRLKSDLNKLTKDK